MLLAHLATVGARVSVRVELLTQLNFIRYVVSQEHVVHTIGTRGPRPRQKSQHFEVALQAPQIVAGAA